MSQLMPMLLKLYKSRNFCSPFLSWKADMQVQNLLRVSMRKNSCMTLEKG